MTRIFYAATLLPVLFYCSLVKAQKTHLDLSQLLKDDKLLTLTPQNISSLGEGDKKGVSCHNGIFYLKDLRFSSGVIEVDMRGEGSQMGRGMDSCFLGIAFHGLDTGTYECIYFRPFNFRETDPIRKTHAVQYISHPDYPWERLRKEHPGVYENAAPSLSPGKWFHVRMVLQDDWITVYIDHNANALLKVKRLGTSNGELLGLWEIGQAGGEFANLVLKKND